MYNIDIAITILVCKYGEFVFLIHFTPFKISEVF